MVIINSSKTIQAEFTALGSSNVNQMIQTLSIQFFFQLYLNFIGNVILLEVAFDLYMLPGLISCKIDYLACKFCGKKLAAVSDILFLYYTVHNAITLHSTGQFL